MSSHYDIAVIGAGAAGLAAGLQLQASGRSFIVLEARNRIGGRAFTDTETLGLPFDCGAHCSIPFFSTVQGAHLSGIAAAEKALRLPVVSSA